MADENLTPAERDLLAKAKWQLMREDCPHEWPQHVIDLLTQLGEARAAAQWFATHDPGEPIPESVVDAMARMDAAQAQAAEGRGT